MSVQGVKITELPAATDYAPGDNIVSVVNNAAVLVPATKITNAQSTADSALSTANAALPASEKGVAGGVATLDASGHGTPAELSSLAYALNARQYGKVQSWHVARRGDSASLAAVGTDDGKAWTVLAGTPVLSTVGITSPDAMSAFVPITAPGLHQQATVRATMAKINNNFDQSIGFAVDADNWLRVTFRYIATLRIEKSVAGVVTTLVESTSPLGTFTARGGVNVFFSVVRSEGAGATDRIHATASFPDFGTTVQASVSDAGEIAALASPGRFHYWAANYAALVSYVVSVGRGG